MPAPGSPQTPPGQNLLLRRTRINFGKVGHSAGAVPLTNWGWAASIIAVSTSPACESPAVVTRSGACFKASRNSSKTFTTATLISGSSRSSCSPASTSAATCVPPAWPG